jgi:MFS transporter, MHS family, proline/betaine transporter
MVTIAIAANVFEWYDLVVFLFVADAIGKNFIPPNSVVTPLLGALLLYGGANLIRPVGAIVLGWLGDVRGRRASLLLSTGLMAGGTILVAVAPTYEAIGAAAPVPIVIARLMQSFSVGGQWGGNTAFIVEWAPEGRRGLWGSLQESSVTIGVLLGSAAVALLSTILTNQAFEDWGWRIPFVFGALIAPIAFYMRHHLQETPIYRRPSLDLAALRSPVSLRQAARSFGFNILWTVAYYFAFAYIQIFTKEHHKLTDTEALWSNTLGLVVLVAVTPLLGHLSDRVGRKPLLVAGCLSFIVLPYPFFWLIVSYPSFALVLTIQVVFGLTLGLLCGAGPAAVAELFPTRTRSTLLSTSVALAVTIFGAFTPAIATRIDDVVSLTAPSYYLIAAAIISTAVIWKMPETACRKLQP